MQRNEAIIEKLEELNPKKIMIWTLIFIGGVIMVTPIIFMISTSLKTGQEAVSYTHLTLPTKA